MDTTIGRECYVALYSQKTSIRDMVHEEAETLNKKGIDRSFYLCDLGDIIDKYQQWIQLMPSVKPFYSTKCNDDIPVLKVLSDLGASFDCASKDIKLSIGSLLTNPRNTPLETSEIEKVLDLGVTPTRVIYAHPCKQPSMLRFAEHKDVRLITFDNVAELYKVKQIHPNAMLVLRIIIINFNKRSYDLDRKFGCHPSVVPSLLQSAKELELNVIGISFHVGSNCREPRAFSVGIQQARHAFDIGVGLGFNMRLLDIGGGFPGDSNTNETFKKMAVVVNQSLQEYFPPEKEVEIIAEPGRYMVASASSIAVNIIAKREVSSTLTGENKDKGVAKCTDTDDNVMYYVNDGVYGSFSSKKTEDRNYEAHSLKTAANADVYESCIWGPTCDSYDVIVDSTNLPSHEVGEWLYFRNMGAYTLPVVTKFNGMEEPRRIYYCFADTWYKLYPERNAENTPDSYLLTY